ncbi:MAG: hypothetical protein PUC12_02410 [Clostridiales bacterium]|nr:hypothetical protein [Clostridiales bacterium]
MFKKEDIESIDRKYFTVIVANEYDIKEMISTRWVLRRSSSPCSSDGRGSS